MNTVKRFVFLTCKIHSHHGICKQHASNGKQPAIISELCYEKHEHQLFFITYASSNFIIMDIHLSANSSTTKRSPFFTINSGLIRIDECNWSKNSHIVNFFLRCINKISTESITIVNIITTSRFAGKKTIIRVFFLINLILILTLPMSNHVADFSDVLIDCTNMILINLAYKHDSQHKSHLQKALRVQMQFLDSLQNEISIRLESISRN